MKEQKRYTEADLLNTRFYGVKRDVIFTITSLTGHGGIMVGFDGIADRVYYTIKWALHYLNYGIWKEVTG